jgi:uncharacterized protein (TIGR03089 family)
MTPEQMFADLLERDPGRPFVTYYDEATGERSELSAKSLANWVAKTHYLLTDELGLGIGDTALIALPAHWISVPALLGCLTAGLALTTGPAQTSETSTPKAAVAFVSAETVSVADGVPDVYAVATTNASLGFGAEVPAGAEDYVTAVRPQADAWAGLRFLADENSPCFEGRNRAQVATAAIDRALELGFGAGARVLSTRPWIGTESWLDTLLAPLAVGGSVVYVRNCPDPAVLERRATQERVTNQL